MSDDTKKTEPAAHWGKLGRRQHYDTALPHNAKQAEICAIIFAGSRGSEFLDLLYAMTIDKRQRAGASDAELREAEAQRRLVAELETLRDKGIEAMAAAKKPD